MDNINNQNKKPFWIKRVYKSPSGALLGLPKKLTEELDIKNHTYMRVYFDRENKMILLAREPDIIEAIRN